MSSLSTNRSTLGNLFSCFRCCGGGDGDAALHATDHVLAPLNLFNPRSAQTSIEHFIAQTEAARMRVYSKLGSLQDFVLTATPPQPGVVGGPRWPTASQRFRVVHRPDGTVLILSDGLSDPFDDLQADANVNGYGLEFYFATPATELGTSPTEIKSSWQFQLLYTVCSLAAGHGGIRSIIDDMHLLSTEAEGVAEVMGNAERRSVLVNKASRVGALLGLTDTALRHSSRSSASSKHNITTTTTTSNPSISTATMIPTAAPIPETIDGMPLNDVRLVNIKLITLSELKLITELGAEGRKKLAELFQGPDRFVSSLYRTPVV